MLGRRSGIAVRARETQSQQLMSDSHRDPGVFERLGRRDPFGWIDGQHLVDEVFGFGSHRVPLGRRKLGRGDETPEWIPALIPIKGCGFD